MMGGTQETGDIYEWFLSQDRACCNCCFCLTFCCFPFCSNMIAQLFRKLKQFSFYKVTLDILLLKLQIIGFLKLNRFGQ